MRIGAPPQSFRHFPQHQICGAPVGGAEQALHLRVVPVFHLEKVPQGRALMTAMDQAEPVRPGPGPAEQGIHRDLGLIGVPAVEVHGDDSALHGRLPPLSRRRAGNALLPL